MRPTWIGMIDDAREGSSVAARHEVDAHERQTVATTGRNASVSKSQRWIDTLGHRKQLASATCFVLQEATVGHPLDSRRTRRRPQ